MLKLITETTVNPDEAEVAEITDGVADALIDDARYRDCIVETKRRQIIELTGLQNRTFTHADEVVRQKHRLEAVKMELEKSSNAVGEESSVEPYSQQGEVQLPGFRDSMTRYRLAADFASGYTRE